MSFVGRLTRAAVLAGGTAAATTGCQTLEDAGHKIGDAHKAIVDTGTRINEGADNFNKGLNKKLDQGTEYVNSKFTPSDKQTSDTLTAEPTPTPTPTANTTTTDSSQPLPFSVRVNGKPAEQQR